MSMMALDAERPAGWEPNTPVSDSLLRMFLVNLTMAFEALGHSLGGRVLQQDHLAAVNVGRPAFIINSATLLTPLFPARAAEVMSALDDFYGFPAGEDPGRVLLFSAWPTPELRDHGWTLLGHAPFMLRPAGGQVQPLPAGLRIEEVRGEDALRAAEEVTVRGFSLADIAPRGPGALFHSALLQDERLRMWVGWEGERPVSTAATFVEAGITNVINVATVPEARGRGFGSAVTWHATLADPALPTLLIASDQGRPVYERMGYMTLFRFTLWSRKQPTG